MDEKSLSHTSWNCKYHIVLVPKYRRKVIYGKLRKDIGKILRTLCDYKHVEIIEAHVMPDHIHMLVSIPPKLAVADFMGYLKGKSTLMIFERHANPAFSRGVMIQGHPKTHFAGAPAQRKIPDGYPCAGCLPLTFSAWQCPESRNSPVGGGTGCTRTASRPS